MGGVSYLGSEILVEIRDYGLKVSEQLLNIRIFKFFIGTVD